MNIQLEQVHDKFLNNLGRMSDAFGYNGFVAKLYGILYLRAKPLSLDELSEGLGVSKGNVSINIRELEQWGAVRKIWVKGSRKDYYEANSNIKKIIANKLKVAIQKRINEVSLMIEEFEKSLSQVDGDLSPEEKDIARGYLGRLKAIEELKDFASRTLFIAEKLF